MRVLASTDNGTPLYELTVIFLRLVLSLNVTSRWGLAVARSEVTAAAKRNENGASEQQRILQEQVCFDGPRDAIFYLEWA